jgi:hypothetical protein
MPRDDQGRFVRKPPEKSDWPFVAGILFVLLFYLAMFCAPLMHKMGWF